MSNVYRGDPCFEPLFIVLESPEEVKALAYVLCNPSQVSSLLANSYKGLKPCPTYKEVYDVLQGLRAQFEWEDTLKEEPNV